MTAAWRGRREGMDLITKLDDERLDIKKNPSFPASITGVRQAISDIMVLRDSLTAALRERDAALRDIEQYRKLYGGLCYGEDSPTAVMQRLRAERNSACETRDAALRERDAHAERVKVLEELIEEIIENYARGPLGEWAYVGNWMNRAKIIGEKSFNEAFERGRRRAGKDSE
jgi:hypothetical protein